MPNPRNPFEDERLHENQLSAEEGARRPEPAGDDSIEGEHHQGPPGEAEPEGERPNSEGDRGLDGFK
jgi:hypothetical protein